MAHRAADFEISSRATLLDESIELVVRGLEPRSEVIVAVSMVDPWGAEWESCGHFGLLASRGYIAFALAYFGIDPLSRTLVEIPLEYLETGIRWFSALPRVRAASLEALGSSKGGELALLLGASFPEIRAVVAMVPSGIVHAGIDFSQGPQLVVASRESVAVRRGGLEEMGSLASPLSRGAGLRECLRVARPGRGGHHHGRAHRRPRAPRLRCG
jgi:fermentation-respiration switch protein FrsA (DUF1100 family)